MKYLLSFATAACAIFGFTIFGFTVWAQTSPPANSTGQKGTTVTERASGPFEVKITPQKPDNKEAEAAGLSRMSGDKQYHGDLEATGYVEMLATSATAPRSGAYVALERVTGKLKRKKRQLYSLPHGDHESRHAGADDPGCAGLRDRRADRTQRNDEDQYCSRWEAFV